MIKNLKNNIYFKIAIIGVLILVLLIPDQWINYLILEREQTQKDAISEVSDKWSNNQTIIGPIVSIPYYRYIKQESKKDTLDKIIKLKEWAHFLPEKLDISGKINPEKRYRGIYEVVVYESSLKLEGKFNSFDFSSFNIPKKDIDYKNAIFTLGISDLKGIEKQIDLHWNTTRSQFNSGTINNDVIENGIHSIIPINVTDSAQYSFKTKIDLKGSQNLYFTPVGKITDATLNSNWKTPSFNGEFLPDSRTINNNGFTAHWNILHLNRNYPQSWLGDINNIRESTFGPDLLLPVDNYKKTYRVGRYAVLFIVLTFMVFFFVEVLQKVYIHPIQYLLVGLALIVFYTLLLSFSEHMQFNLAYILATILTLSLITAYSIAILKSKKVGMLIFGILLILYIFIFAIIQLEDYALLIGSLGLFAILAVVMYYSRKIDWYNLKLGK